MATVLDLFEAVLKGKLLICQFYDIFVHLKKYNI